MLTSLKRDLVQSLWRNRIHQSIISHLQKRSLGCLGDIVLCIGDYTIPITHLYSVCKCLQEAMIRTTN